jgi:hypothetical protein
MFVPTQILEGMYVWLRANTDAFGPQITTHGEFLQACADAEQMDWTPEQAQKVLLEIDKLEGGLVGWLADNEAPIFVTEGETSNTLSNVVVNHFRFPKKATA